MKDVKYVIKLDKRNYENLKDLILEETERENPYLHEDDAWRLFEMVDDSELESRPLPGPIVLVPRSSLN